jgi:hypothetical protein
MSLFEFWNENWGFKELDWKNWEENRIKTLEWIVLSKRWLSLNLDFDSRLLYLDENLGWDVFSLYLL